MERGSRLYVFDAFPLVAYFKHEPAAPRVREVLETGQRGESLLLMTVVNWGEVLYTAHELRAASNIPETAAMLDSLPIVLREIDRDLALLAA